MKQPARSDLKTGKRPVQQQICSFKAGDTLFTEGSTGRELFIIHEGKVGIYKDTPDGRIELAKVERGSLIGEMSLLDTLPRSATVVALDEVKALVIGYAQFQSIMKTIPVWLQSIIRIVVSRLRDANRRVDQTILRNRERGIISLIKLLYPVAAQTVDKGKALLYDTLIIEAFYVCRLRKKEIVGLIINLEKRSVISVMEEKTRKYITVDDFNVLDLYEEYLLLKSQKRTFKELTLPKETVLLLSNIVFIAQKKGVTTGEGTSLKKSLLDEEVTDKKKDNLEKRLLDLRRHNLINLFPNGNETEIVFRKEALARINRIKEWIPRFEKELS
jgi:CRP/FNR family transcriptional regulator, cyclic AMP receptor protein